MNTPQDSKYEYGILLVNGRYVAEKVEEGKSYVMYFAHRLHLVDAEGRDPLKQKGWTSLITWECECYCNTGFSYDVFIRKDGQEIDFQIEIGEDMLSDLANIMMGILNKCETIDDLRQLYAEYLNDLESRYETIEGAIAIPPYYNKERGCTIASFFYRPCNTNKRIAWYSNSYINEGKCKARGKWKQDDVYGWLFYAEEIEFFEKPNVDSNKPLSQLINEGKVFEQEMFADLYYDNLDYSRALELYTLAAEAGSFKAQKRIGDCYARGHGVKQDTLRAIEWYTKAAEAGNRDAECELALLYAEKAKEWMIRYNWGNTELALQRLADYYGFDLVSKKKCPSRPSNDELDILPF